MVCVLEIVKTFYLNGARWFPDYSLLRSVVIACSFVFFLRAVSAVSSTFVQPVPRVRLPIVFNFYVFDLLVSNFVSADT